MSTPPDILSQIIQGGLLNYGQPSSLDSGLMSGNPSMALGMNLLANSDTPGNFGSILGRSMLGTQEQQQKNAGSQMDLLSKAQQMRMDQMQQQAIQTYLRQLGVGQQPAPQMPGMGQAAAPDQTATAVAGQQPQDLSQTQQQPSLFGGSSDIATTPVNGMAPNLYRMLGVASKKDPLTIEKELRAAQISTAQDQIRPQLDAVDTLIQSDQPAQYMKADPRAMAVWQSTAPRLGMNPITDFNDRNVRTALTIARNEAASRVNLPVIKAPAQMINQTLPDGRIAQTDPITGKQTIESASPLVKVVGKDGKAVYVPEAKAAGMRPYNEMTAASDDALQATAEDVGNYRLAPPTGAKLLSGNWPEVMRLVKAVNPNYDATQYQTKQKARSAFATGKQGDAVRSLSVANDHLDQLKTAADALNNGDIQGVNAVVNWFKTQGGHPEVTDFNSMKEIVGDEVAKAVLGSGAGTGGERDALKAAFAAKNGPRQIYGTINKYKGLMGGQLNGLRRQYERSTGLKDFDTALSSEAQQELSGGAIPSLDVGQEHSVGGFTVKRVQ